MRRFPSDMPPPLSGTADPARTVTSEQEPTGLVERVVLAHPASPNQVPAGSPEVSSGLTPEVMPGGSDTQAARRIRTLSQKSPLRHS